MADHLGSFDANSTLRFFFTTHAQTGAAVAPSSGFEAADIRVYKNGSATQRASEVGYTMTSPFDSVTGLHAIAIDLSDNTDAGFYASGSEYAIVLVPDETVDSLAIAAVLAYFSIERVGKVNVTQLAGVAQSLTDLKDFADTGYDPVAHAVASLSTTERDAIAAALLDLANGIETGKTPRQAWRIVAAALAGKRSNALTATEQYDAIGSPGTARIVGNLDGSGNGVPTLTP